MLLLGIPDNLYSIAYDTARLAYGIARHACKLKRITNGLPIGWCLTKRNKQFGETPTCRKDAFRIIVFNYSFFVALSNLSFIVLPKPSSGNLSAIITSRFCSSNRCIAAYKFLAASAQSPVFESIS